MHIGAGEFVGRTLKNSSCRGASCRALTIKEVIFTFIGSRVSEATVLDINDQNGMFGIESLSRGAKICRFVNPERDEVKTIGENLKSLSLESTERIFDHSISEFIESPLNQEIATEKYDVIFFEVRESGEFELVNEVFKKQKRGGITVVIFPNLNGFILPKIQDGEIFESREFEDRKVALIIKNQKK